MRQTLLALNCVLLLVVLQGQCLLAATVRPYKFGFTIEEQQHRAESRDERGIVMGEFGFITADGIYHVTVYATDENGKFRIISMKSYPYASPGPKAPLAPPPTTSTQRTIPTVPQQVFSQKACSGCFLVSSLSEKKGPSTKTEIRPLSQPLSTPAAAVSGEQLALLGQVTGQRHTVFLPSTQITHTQTYTQAPTPTQTLTQSHSTNGLLGQASFHNVDAVREASVQMAVVAEIPQDLAGIEGVRPQLLNPFEIEQLAIAPAPAPPTAPTAPTAPTTLAPVVVNAQAVALSHAIAKVQGQRPTARPDPSASAPQPQQLPPLGAIGSLGAQLSQLDKIPPAATGSKDLNTFVFGQPLEVVKAKLGVVAPAQVSTATAVNKLNTYVIGLPLAVPSVNPDLAKGQRIDGNVLSAIPQVAQSLEQRERIPPAPTTIKDVNAFASGLPSDNVGPALTQLVSGKPPQSTLPVTNVVAPGSNKDRNSFAFGQLQPNRPQLAVVNVRPTAIVAQVVSAKTPQLALPVRKESAGTASINVPGSIALGQLSASKQQLPLGNIKPALINADLVNAKKPQLALPVTNVVAPGSNKDRNSFAFGQLQPNRPQLAVVNVKPTAIVAEVVNAKKPQSALPVTNTIGSAVNKYPTSSAQQPASGQQLPVKVFKPTFVKAQSLNGDVFTTMQQLVLPVNREIAGFVSQQSKNGLDGLAPKPLAPRGPSIRIPAASPSQFPTIVAASRPVIQAQTQTNTPAQTKTAAQSPSAAQTLTVAHTLPISAQSKQPLLKPVSSASAGALRPALTATQQKQQPTGIQAQQGQQPFGSNADGLKPGQGQQGQQPFGSNAAGLRPGQGQQGQQPSGINSVGFKPILGGAQPQQRQQPSGSNTAGLKPSLGGVLSQQGSQNSGSNAAGFKPSLGGVQSQQGQQPSSGSLANNIPTTTKQQRLQPSGSNLGSYTPDASKTGTNAADLTGDLYRFKYLLDYNGHEETGSRNGDKVGNYFVIGSDAVEHMVKYIANEFGFQPHITWRKLDGNEAQLPAENALKHYEFKWFNKDSQ